MFEKHILPIEEEINIIFSVEETFRDADFDPLTYKAEVFQDG